MNGTRTLATNEDGSWNGPASPAARGSLLTFWTTGEGLDSGIRSIAVTLGGAAAAIREATVVQPGLSRFTVEVPRDTPPGEEMLTVTAGHTSSAGNVTVAIR